MNNFNKDELPIVEYPHRCPSSDLLAEQLKAKDKRIAELFEALKDIRDNLIIELKAENWDTANEDYMIDQLFRSDGGADKNAAKYQQVSAELSIDITSKNINLNGDNVEGYKP